MSDNKDTFASFGETYQEKVVQALIEDPMFAEQMADVLLPKYFDKNHLQEIVTVLFAHKTKHKTYPSIDILEVMTTRENEDLDPLVKTRVREFLTKVKNTTLDGDKGYIEESSLEFCKKQALKEGLVKAIDMMEVGKYDQIQTVIRDAMGKGGTRDMGHDYNEDYLARGQKSVRKPIPTGWQVLDTALNGGWEKSTLCTFIAPTGAGKSMFLVNCGAAALAQGLNVAYITLEMADWKIGLRFDSYYTGIPINDVPSSQEQIREVLKEKAKGRLFIKEWPTKSATVQTVRAYLQRLIATKGFKPDMVIVDYADLLRGSKGHADKRFELEGVYEELRAMSQEFNVVVITADQTNRSGLDMEIVTIAQIGESYSKATVCDVIMTISRTMADKQNNTGRLYLAKSRLGQDGMVFPFLLNTATVKVDMLKIGSDPVAVFMENNQARNERMQDRFQKMMGAREKRAGSDT